MSDNVKRLMQEVNDLYLKMVSTKNQSEREELRKQYSNKYEQLKRQRVWETALAVS